MNSELHNQQIFSSFFIIFFLNNNNYYYYFQVFSIFNNDYCKNNFIIYRFNNNDKRFIKIKITSLFKLLNYLTNFKFYFFLIYIRFNTFKSLCKFYLIASSWRWVRDVYIISIFFLMLCIKKFFTRKFYKREIFFCLNNFVVWNWFNRSIVNIIRTAIVIALRSLNNHFMFVIFTFCNIFFFSFFNSGRKATHV